MVGTTDYVASVGVGACRGDGHGVPLAEGDRPRQHTARRHRNRRTVYFEAVGRSELLKPVSRAIDSVNVEGDGVSSVRVDRLVIRVCGDIVLVLHSGKVVPF